MQRISIWQCCSLYNDALKRSDFDVKLSYDPACTENENKKCHNNKPQRQKTDNVIYYVVI